MWWRKWWCVDMLVAAEAVVVMVANEVVRGYIGSGGCGGGGERGGVRICW